MYERRAIMKRWLIALWALGGIFFLIGRALWRLSTIAYDGIVNYEVSTLQWIVLIIWVVVSAYSEGYRGFHLKFSPRTAARCWHLADHPGWLPVILGPLYAMGFFHANRRTILTAYIMVGFIVSAVMLMQMLPQPWRGVIDAGVVVGLGLGLLSVLWYFFRAAFGHANDLDPCLPDAQTQH